jgi:hypothetical protein
LVYLQANKKIDTIGGVASIIGITIVNMKIFEITKKVRIYIIRSEFCKHEIILGLDLIPSFRLCLNHELKLSQLSNVKGSVSPQNPPNNVKEIFFYT